MNTACTTAFHFNRIILFVCFCRMLLTLFPFPSLKSQEFVIGLSSRGIGRIAVRGLAVTDWVRGLGGGVRE